MKVADLYVRVSEEGNPGRSFGQDVQSAGME
jgi:hypothetical protein